MLEGSGVSLQHGREDIACEIRAGDCLVHRANREYHTLRAGDDGLDVLVFGTRVPIEVGELPRAGVSWVSDSWAELGAGAHPWEREVAAGEPELPVVGERPPNVVNVEEVEGENDGSWKRLGREAGSEVPGESGTPHCHSAEEELYVVSRATARCRFGQARSSSGWDAASTARRCARGTSSRTSRAAGPRTGSRLARTG